MNTHTIYPVFTKICYSTQCLCTPSALSRPPHPVSQHCALDESASVCVWKANGAWCGLGQTECKATRSTDLLFCLCIHKHTQIKIPSVLSQTYIIDKWHQKKNLTVQQAVLSFPGLLWPSLQCDDKHQPVLLWRPHVPTHTDKIKLNSHIVYKPMFILPM